MKELSIKFVKYSLVGCISTLIYFLSVFIFVEIFDKNPVFSSAVAFVIMTVISFFLNKRFTFGSDFSYDKLLRFLAVSAIGFTLNFGIMYLIVNVFSLHYVIGELVTTLVIPVINFILNNYWTFK
ncbi:GtrA family protein [Robertmurraya yapensis]|uniref:GtrA family protein n=1 Tax=Bacillus yapensis TaxID=2492960 RepID=A0A3S0KL52_9BACI|nr:GtrA family protein [Bacillus yapensis]RTR29110.1 GtrA family protein [Bacillus yapensis]TKS94715.1 GtrA family protein [Bacillus yapensis]